ncbi:MAG: type II secretion system protein [bacterium]|nr:type II secretion system protein [bacterium]
MKTASKHSKGFTLIELMVVISIIGVLATMGLAAFNPIKMMVNKMKSKDNMKQLLLLLNIYQQQLGSYPTVQPNSTRYTRGGGVKDLYPLWETQLMKKEQLKLLQPPGVALIPFSQNPSKEEFDKLHIGYSYNSTAIPDDPNNPPIISERGVSDGRIDKTENPVFGDGAHVLFGNSNTEFIPAVNGKLSTKDVTADQWGKLLD